MYIRLLENAVADNWPMLAIFFVTMVTLRIFYMMNHREKSSFYKEVFNIFAVLYVLLLFELLTNSEANIGGGYNIIPFMEMTRYTFGSNLFMLNVVGNVLVFIPFGYFVSTYVKAFRVTTPLLIATIVSTTVEFIQLNIGRSFDIDDILLNVFGTIIGYLLYVGLTAIKAHLPKIFQKDGLYNVFCIIIIIVIVLYVFKLVGVL